MTKTITIQGIPVEISQPYAAGHVITEAEAKALNQVRGENIGNNLRKAITEMKGDGDVTAELAAAVQALVSEKDAAYEFTLASVGGGSTARLDPLTKECRAVARSYLTGKLKELGKTQKQYAEENGEDAFMSKVVELSEHPEIVKIAKKTLAEREKMAGIGEIAL